MVKKTEKVSNKTENIKVEVSNENKVPYIAKRERIGQVRWIKICEVGYKKFIESGNSKYKFSQEGKQGVDFEAYYLSKMVFSKLFNLFAQKDYEFGITSSCRMVSKSEDFRLYFDIMNNPNVSNDSNRLGNKAINKNVDCNDWVQLKYTVGNFAPIPANKKGERHFQMIHNNFNERWDLLLEYFKKYWDELPCSNVLNFDEYMMYTCQHLYYKKIFEEFKAECKGDLDNIGDIDWKGKVERWNDQISKGECKDLISFDDEIEKVVDDICFLIEARGRCIMNILKPNK